VEDYDEVSFPEFTKALLEGKIVTYRWTLSRYEDDFTKDTYHPSHGFSLQMMREAKWYIRK
jgi:hypothetical protein